MAARPAAKADNVRQKSKHHTKPARPTHNTHNPL